MSFATNPAAFGIKPASSNALANAPPLGASTQIPATSNPFSTTFGGFGSGATQPASGTGGFGNTTTPATGATNPFTLGGQSSTSGTTPQNPFAGFGTTPQTTQPQQGAATAPANPFAPTVQPSATALNPFSSLQPQNPAGTGTTQTQPQANPFTSFGSTLGQQPQQQPQQPAANPFAGFGSTLGQQNQNQPQQINPFTLSGFGTQPQQQPQQGAATAGFGGLQPQATVPAGGFGSTLGGSTLFGNRTPSQQPPQPGFGFSTTQPTGPPPFVNATKFNDLSDEIKKELEGIESHIQSRIQISKELHQRKLGEEATKGQELIRGVYKDLVNTTTTIKNDINHTQDIKKKVDQTVEDIIVAMRIVDGFKNPQAGGHYLKSHAGFPLEYFLRVTEEMKERLQWYKSTIEQIERKLSASSTPTSTPQAIAQTIQAQNATFLALAAKTAALDHELQKIKALYTQLWRARTGSMRDPFQRIDRSEVGGGSDFGMKSLSVKP